MKCCVEKFQQPEKRKNAYLKQQKMKYLLLFFTALLCLAATCNKAVSSDDCIDKSKIDPNMACIEIYQPVCGCDGKTYSNDCFAKAAGLKSWKEGPCEGN